MHERIVEILLFLVSELRSNKQLNDVDISMLTRNGYTQSEISTAFTWLFEQMSGVENKVGELPRASDASHRFLSEPEKMVISAEAYGYLIQFQELGLLDNVDVETVIDRIMSAGFGMIGLPEMKSLIAGLLFDLEHGSSSSGRLSAGHNESIH